MAERTDTVEQVFEQGKACGMLSAEDVEYVLELLNYDILSLEAFYDRCSEENILIVDDDTGECEDLDEEVFPETSAKLDTVPDIACKDCENTEPDIEKSDYPALSTIPEEKICCEEQYSEHNEAETDSGTGLRSSVYDYLVSIGGFPLLNANEETELASRVAAGDKAAKKRFIECNLRLVVNIAKRYTYTGIPLADLIEEGNIGLFSAVERFDPSRSYKFSTYATWWIRQAITRYIANCGRVVRLPVHVQEIANKLLRAMTALKTQCGPDINYADVAEELNLPEYRVAQILLYFQDPLSLDEKITEDSDNTYGDFIPDSADTENEVSNSVLHSELEAMLSEFSERDQYIIRKRWGLIDGRQHTLEEVARELNLSRERVRQIEDKIFRRLRRNKKCAARLKVFLVS